MLNGNCEDMKSGAETGGGSTKLVASDVAFVCIGCPARKGRGTESACGGKLSKAASALPGVQTVLVSPGKMFKSYDLSAFYLFIF